MQRQDAPFELTFRVAAAALAMHFDAAADQLIVCVEQFLADLAAVAGAEQQVIQQRIKDRTHSRVEEIRKGGKAAYALVRPRACLPVNAFDEDGDRSVQQILADRELDTWCGKCWRPDQLPELPCWPVDLGAIAGPGPLEAVRSS